MDKYTHIPPSGAQPERPNAEPASAPTEAPARRPFTVNIGRQLGSGGRAIGHLLAERLGMDYFDKEILAIAAKESGFCTEIFERNDEHKGFFNTMFGNMAPFYGSSEAFYATSVSEVSLFRLQAEAIRKAAARKSCVFIGRCADYVLRDFPRCVNVFVAADPADRIRRICKAREVDEKTALRIMETGDRKRADYYNFYSSGTWGAADTYHLCINSSRLGIEGTAQFVQAFVERALAEEEAAEGGQHAAPAGEEKP